MLSCRMSVCEIRVGINTKPTSQDGTIPMAVQPSGTPSDGTAMGIDPQWVSSLSHIQKHCINVRAIPIQCSKHSLLFYGDSLLVNDENQ